MLRLVLLALLSVACAHPPIPYKPGGAMDAQMTGYKYPQTVKYFKVKSQKHDLKMAYMFVRPAKTNGQTVLLMHGKNFSGYYWAPTMKKLLSEGFQVLVPDQIGFGKSSKPTRYQYSFQTLALNTKKLVDRLKLKSVTVVGHSMGGMLATRFALMYPETVSRLVLVNPLGLEDWKLKVPYPGVDAAYAAELKQTPDSIRAYQKENYYDGQWKPEYDKLIEPAVAQTKDRRNFVKLAWTAALTSDMVLTQPVLYEFKKLTVPTLLIIGTRDRTAPGKQLVSEDVRKTLGQYEALGKKAQKSIKGSKLVELPGVGHLPQVEAFEAYITALVEFLPQG